MRSSPVSASRISFTSRAVSRAPARLTERERRTVRRRSAVRTVAQPPTLAASGGRIRARSESSAPSVPLAETP